MKKGKLSNEKDPERSSCHVLLISSFLILAGTALYLYAISNSGPGIVKYGFFWGVMGLLGWLLITFGLLISCWVAIRKIIKNFQSPPG
ncbi:hypothetical protein [Kiloniella antarctica]|uniref:Uncharacterized protein n=1 Tax=Kiloniella antarctica TaxID=1550907 RepID=A0ABW5BKB7_9PROT